MSGISGESGHFQEFGDCYEILIEGQKFMISTEADRDEQTGEPTGQWRGWCFFAYDIALNIFPADSVPPDVKVRESILSCSGRTQDEVRQAVADKLRSVILTKSLEGTGIYSPPADRIYPQEFPTSE